MDSFDYIVVDEVLKVGGRLKCSVDLKAGEIVVLPGAEIHGVPLSKAHKSPFCEWAAGASLLKVGTGQPGEVIARGKRGRIDGFSFASRRRLMYMVAKVRRDAELPCFVTLTYPNNFPSPIESKRHLKIFIKRLLRKFNDIGFIWKLEPQERGAPHYHLLVWGSDESLLRAFVPEAWFEIAGNGDRNHLRFHLGMLPKSEPCVNQVRSREGVMRYASKYLGKTFEVAGWDEIYPGRFWAVVQKENIPFGKEVVMYITKKDAHVWMRYQRRFAKLKSRRYLSLTTFCNADQWIKNIMDVNLLIERSS